MKGRRSGMEGNLKAGKSELLDVLSDVKTRVQDKLGIVDFPMPQFILIGKQSVGKSRLIEALAGQQFNFVSGTLGSRRPTVLEFRNVQQYRTPRWFILDKKSNQWGEYPLPQVMQIIGDAHEALGASVSSEPVYVRVESPVCVDMQIVDLPGFREFALDNDKQHLANQIESLVVSFMKDERNVMLCVEEAGDAANLATLTRCKKIDPSFSRTVLIRNKLDKYYQDLNPSNINDWCNGYGDLPAGLMRFAVTLPHWPNEKDDAPAAFAEMRLHASEQDVNTLKARGMSEKFLSTVGFMAFSQFMERKIEQMFAAAIGPVLMKLRELKVANTKKMEDLRLEVDNTNPHNILSTVREAGVSFAHALSHVMEGFVRSADSGRMSLDQELGHFHEYHRAKGTYNSFTMLPSEDFSTLNGYTDFLRSEIKCPAFDAEINGGAQFRRMMFEVEVFLRFSEICTEMKMRDVIQARGVSMMSLTWRDVVVKLLSNEAHLPLARRVQYVGERIKWFFEMQKGPILNFMCSLKDSPDQHMYSALFHRHHKLITENEMIKQLVFTTYDETVSRQLTQFIDLFNNMLASTFSNPWVFMKRTAMALNENSLEDVCLPSFEDTKGRIPSEITERGTIENTLTKWLGEIPSEPKDIDVAVDNVQRLVLKTYSFIRSQVCDQVELFAESFFKLPMLRRLEEDMSKIELSEVDRQTYAVRREMMLSQLRDAEAELQEVSFCIDKLQAFSVSRVPLPGASKRKFGE